MGISNVTLPNDPIQGKPSFAAALKAFDKLRPVRILFDNGGPSPGKPYAGFERSFSRFPVPHTRARSWYLGHNGTLKRKAPTKPGQDSFTWTSQPGRRPTSRATPRRETCGPTRPTTSGCRTRRARRLL